MKKGFDLNTHKVVAKRINKARISLEIVQSFLEDSGGYPENDRVHDICKAALDEIKTLRVLLSVRRTKDYPNADNVYY